MALIVAFVNQETRPTTYADYRVTVLVNHDEIARGEVAHHRRDDGWAVLLAKFLKQNYPEALEAVQQSTRRRVETTKPKKSEKTTATA